MNKIFLIIVITMCALAYVGYNNINVEYSRCGKWVTPDREIFCADRIQLINIAGIRLAI